MPEKKFFLNILMIQAKSLNNSPTKIIERKINSVREFFEIQANLIIFINKNIFSANEIFCANNDIVGFSRK